MDIGGNNKGVAGRLSNFTKRPFTIDGIECDSMEGFLQALKFENENAQIATCKLVGVVAKRKGKGRNKRWQSLQKLWWKGKAYDRKSDEYQNLITRAYDELSKNENFKKDLLSTGNAVFTHGIGKNDKKKTVLTENEFCRQLMRVRNIISQQD